LAFLGATTFLLIAILYGLVQNVVQESALQVCVGVFILLTSLVVGLANLWFLEKLFLSRVANLSEEIRLLGSRGDLSARVKVSGQDELSQLAWAINQMLEKLEQAQQERHEAETRYRTLVEHLPAVTYIAELDLYRSVRYISPQIEALLGFSGHEWEVDPQIWVQQLHPEDRERVLSQLAQSRAHHEPFRSEYRLRRKDRSVIWVQDEAVVLQDAGSSAFLLQGVLMDITERKRVEESLLNQLARIQLLNRIARAIIHRHDLNSLFQVVLHCLEEQLPVDCGAVCLLDAAADTLRMSACSPRFQEIAQELDWTPGTGMPVAHSGLQRCLQGETVYFPDTALADAPLAKSLARHGLRSLVATPLAADSEVFGVLMASRRRVEGFSSEESQFLKTLSDHVALAASQARLHSDLQQAYQDLRRTQQAVLQQERLRSLGQMASGIAHDINNSLSPIVGFADLLLIRETQLSDQARRYLSNIKTAGQDIAHTVSRMREFYRPRGQEDSLLPVSLPALVEEVLELSRPRWRDMPQAQGRVIEMRTDWPPDLPLVLGIESEIREALTNLIFNAVDALPEGGTITVRMYQREEGQGPTSAVVLEVSDNGMGMDEETQQRCLEPFYSTKGDRGTGLGLAMVYGVMQRHDGHIEIESQVGRGTTMRLVFPLRSLAQMDTELLPEEPEVRPTYRVLFIDDEPLVRQLVQAILESEGHQVEVAADGTTGLTAFYRAQEQGTPFEVVITDLGMPYMDGKEVARKVKATSATTSVILLTGWGTWLHRDPDLRNWVDDILSKPPTVETLRRSLLRINARGNGSQSATPVAQAEACGFPG